MKKFFMRFLACLLPWLVLFLYDNPGGAIVALIMQATCIGWLPASMWAFKVVNAEAKQEEERAKAEAEKAEQEKATEQEKNA